MHLCTSPFTAQPVFTEKCIDARRKVISDAFFSVDKDLMSCSALLKKVQEFPDSKNIEVLDLSENNLIDTDMPTVAKMALALPSLVCLYLNVNRFSGSPSTTLQLHDAALRDILILHKSLQFVVMYANPFASIERSKFIQGLSSDGLLQAHLVAQVSVQQDDLACHVQAGASLADYGYS